VRSMIGFRSMVDIVIDRLHRKAKIKFDLS
jgi:hypothetical protein